MEKMNSTQKKYLRGLAHHLKPMVMIGKNGLTETVLGGADKALSDHELIKVKFLDFKDKKKELSAVIEKETTSHLIGIIGNVAIFFRFQPDDQKRKINLPEK